MLANGGSCVPASTLLVIVLTVFFKLNPAANTHLPVGTVDVETKRAINFSILLEVHPLVLSERSKTKGPSINLKFQFFYIKEKEK